MTHTIIGDFGSGEFTATNVSQGGINGSSLIVRVVAINNAGTEYFRLDNFQLFGVTLGTTEFSLEDSKIYPNPTNTGFVNIKTAANDAIEVVVYDVLGKQVLNETITNNTLNISRLNTGVYIVKLSQNGATVTKKLVIK